MGRTLYHFSCFDVKAALVTGTLQNVPVFMIIEFAAEVCTFAGKCPMLVVTVEKDKICGDQKTGCRYRLVDVDIGRFFGDFEAGKL